MDKEGRIINEMSLCRFRTKDINLAASLMTYSFALDSHGAETFGGKTEVFFVLIYSKDDEPMKEDLIRAYREGTIMVNEKLFVSKQGTLKDIVWSHRRRNNKEQGGKNNE